MQDQQARSIEAGLHVGQHIGNALVFDDRFIKLHAITGIGQCGFKCCTGDPQRLRCNTDATAFKIGQGNRQALATLTQQIGLRHGAVAQRDSAGVRGADAHFVFCAIDDEARRGSWHQKRRKALFTQLRISDGKHDGEFGALAVADKLFGAVDHPVAVMQFCAGTQVVGFGAGLRFSKAKTANGLTAGKFCQPGLLLRFVAVFEDRATAYRVVNAHQRAGGAIAGRNLFDRQGVGYVINIGATPFFWYHHTEQTQLAHFRDQGVVNPACFFPRLGMGRDFATGKITGHVANHYVFFAQFDVLHGSDSRRFKVNEKTRDFIRVQAV